MVENQEKKKIYRYTFGKHMNMKLMIEMTETDQSRDNYQKNKEMTLGTERK